ncbi:MAG: choloylglycine hydrolase family protein [Deltaproteobacteria bacterium]|nr:choloylglycine hydrolase family protein [Deltaproteobacteria bacterium]NND28156.1 choloylglycine hydrolase family protein [Myxococcales bacterium]MBT8466429.1 choloylglycine hydrolase family protein [Deltaproteobacteria bacterium]MBT8480523.1 choloylglycine hydrolase family protein [Deltaproteobacteria bacterium]NNK06562.1 choloylglycine hydrolase family protein [Myxococcales bacterium]
MCTGLALTAKDGGTVQGRTMEWGAFDFESTIMVTPRGTEFQGETPDGINGLKWKAKYGAIGVTAVQLPLYCDGMNDQGLVVSMLFMAHLVDWEPYDPKLASQSVSGTYLGNWLLTNCASIEDVKTELPKIRVVPVPLAALGGMPTPVHFLITDASGKSVVVEYTDHERHIYDNPVGVLTNNPTFPWHLTNLSNYIGLHTAPNLGFKLGDYQVNPQGTVGSGMIGLPGDYSPPSRFVKVAALRNTVTELDTSERAVEEVFRILNNFDIPLGAVDSEERNRIMGDTQWTTCYDSQEMLFYFRTCFNHRIRVVDLKAIDFTSGEVREQPLEAEKEQDYAHLEIA